MPKITKKLLILTGASIVGFFIFAILHNVVSGVLKVEEPVFFILAVIICPIGLMIGVIGSIVSLVNHFMKTRVPKMRKNTFWLFVKHNHVVIFLSLTCLFLLLWNLDRYFPICPYGTIPFIIGIIMELLIWGER